jgi:hypothetical protein
MALRTLTAVGFFILGCSTEKSAVSLPVVPLGPGAFNSLYVAESDFSTGGVQRVDLSTGRTSAPFPAHADSVVQWDSFGKRAVVVNRLAGNHLTLASSDLSKMLLQIPLPDSSNPQDVLALGNGQAYVASLASARLSRWDLETGREVGTGVDLSQWADGDGSPEASALLRYKHLVFVLLQRLDTRTYEPNKVSYFLSVDPKSDEVVGVQKLGLKKPIPFAYPKILGDDLFIGEAGVLDRKTPVLDGAIERFDARTQKSRGFIVSEKDLGGDILDFEMLDGARGVAIVSTPVTRVVAFDSATGRVKTLLDVERPGLRYAQVLADHDRNVFFVLDRDTRAPGVRVFGFDLLERVEQRIGLELPPFRAVLAP